MPVRNGLIKHLTSFPKWLLMNQTMLCINTLRKSSPSLRMRALKYVLNSPRKLNIFYLMMEIRQITFWDGVTVVTMQFSMSAWPYPAAHGEMGRSYLPSYTSWLIPNKDKQKTDVETPT